MSVQVTIQETVNDVTVNAMVQTVDVTVEASDVANDIAASNASRAETARILSEGVLEDVQELSLQIQPAINQGLLDINNAASAGVQAVEDAEASALQAINQSEQQAVLQVENARDLALQNVADATVTATNAADTATQQAGIATAQAQVATGAANTATQQAGIATTQAGIATTAANTIFNQIDFTGAQSFDFLQRDGVNFKAVRENVPLNRVQVFDKAPINGGNRLFELNAWDNFVRPNGNLTTTDNNIPYTALSGDLSNKILSNSLRLTSPNIITIPLNFSFLANVKIFATWANNARSGITWGIDINNRYELLCGTNLFALNKIIGGVTTLVSGISITNNLQQLGMKNLLVSFIHNSGNIGITAYYQEHPNQVINQNLNADLATFPNINQFTFFGFTGPLSGGQDVSRIYSFSLQRITTPSA